jgi:hypothetical protein
MNEISTVPIDWSVLAVLQGAYEAQICIHCGYCGSKKLLGVGAAPLASEAIPLDPSMTAISYHSTGSDNPLGLEDVAAIIVPAIFWPGETKFLNPETPEFLSQPAVHEREVESFLERNHILDLRQRLFGSLYNKSERNLALMELASLDDECLPPFIIAELRRPVIDEDWKAQLVLAAEQIQFTNASDRDFLKMRLRDIASGLQKARDPKFEPMVWSAIRCLASMLSPNEVVTLTNFLRVPNGIETRQVALQAVQNIFANMPPPSNLSLETLADRVFYLASEGLNAEQFSPGKPAALVLNALLALAALGDTRLAGCVSRVAALKKDWFSRQLRTGLEKIGDRWKTGGHTVKGSRPPLDQVIRCIEYLGGH